MIENMPYKAKLKNLDKWIYGYYAAKQSTTYCIKEDYERSPVETKHYIIKDQTTDWGLPNELRPYKVHRDTVCRNTGCVDQDNTPIFENDIVVKVLETFATNANGDKLACFTRTIKGIVKFKNGAFGVETQENGDGQFLCFFEDKCKVIGNVFDNPELLEGLYEENLQRTSSK